MPLYGPDTRQTFPQDRADPKGIPPAPEPITLTVEVVDKNNRLLAAVAPELVKAHQLLHRATALLIFLPSGKLVLQKKRAPARTPPLWGIPSTRLVKPFEAQHHIAFRLLATSMNIHTARIHQKPTIFLASDYGPLFLSLFSCRETASLPIGHPHLVVDVDELDELVREYSELLSPLTRQLCMHGLQPFKS